VDLNFSGWVTLEKIFLKRLILPSYFDQQLFCRPSPDFNKVESALYKETSMYKIFFYLCGS
jgi:hypothetical protein